MVAYGSHEGLIGLPKILDKIDMVVRNRMVGCAQDLLSTLIMNTPIDTGRARRSWQAYVDTYTESGMTGEPPYVGGVEIEMRGKDKGRFLSAPRTSSVSGIRDFDPKKHTNIVVSSNVPYMARLNRGWSRQATAGWIERCIDEVTSRWGVA
jgi:hypothetical protein